MTKTIEDCIDDMEDIYLAEKSLAEVRAGAPTISHENILNIIDEAIETVKDKSAEEAWLVACRRFDNATAHWEEEQAIYQAAVEKRLAFINER
jgi:hypothetical protein